MPLATSTLMEDSMTAEHVDCNGKVLKKGMLVVSCIYKRNTTFVILSLESIGKLEIESIDGRRDRVYTQAGNVRRLKVEELI